MIYPYLPPPQRYYDCLICADVIKRFPIQTRKDIVLRMANYLNENGILILVNPSPLFFYINPIWRFIRGILFRSMSFQDEFCGKNSGGLRKVEYYDAYQPLHHEIPDDTFSIVSKKKIGFKLLSVVIAKKIAVFPGRTHKLNVV